MSAIHVLRTPVYYIAQTRRIAGRLWDDVNKVRYATPEEALAQAVSCMRSTDNRARALAIPYGETGSYYEPTVAMEAKRI